MAENTETVENQPVAEVTTESTTTEEPNEPQTFTAEQVEEIKKEWQTKGYVSGKKDTNAKWEAKIAEEKAEAKKQAEREKMSEIERANTEMMEAKQQAEEYKRDLDLLKQQKETIRILQQNNLEPEMLDHINVIVPNDMEKTEANIKAVKAWLDAKIQKGVESRIQPQGIPKQNQGEGNDTKNKFRTMIGL